MKIEDLSPDIQTILEWRNDSPRGKEWTSYWSGDGGGIQLHPSAQYPDILATSCVLTDEHFFWDQYMTALFADRIALFPVADLERELLSRPLTTERDEFIAWAKMALALRGEA